VEEWKSGRVEEWKSGAVARTKIEVEIPGFEDSARNDGDVGDGADMGRSPTQLRVNVLRPYEEGAATLGNKTLRLRFFVANGALEDDMGFSCAKHRMKDGLRPAGSTQGYKSEDTG